jgi:NAD(P)-dependent dehydrogenase (short-subunit alcohol dehydrogenase family)
LELVKQLASVEGNQVYAACRQSSSALKEVGHVSKTIENIDVASDDVGATLVGALAGEAPFDVVINNAGILQQDSLLQVSGDALMHHFNVNSVGPIRVTQALLNAQLVSQGAKLVFVSSRLGSIGDRPSGGLYAYRMSKAALNMAVVNMAGELAALAKKGEAPSGIITSPLHPGWVATDMGSQRAPVQPADAAANIIAHCKALTSEDSGKFADMTSAGEELPW